MQKNTAIATKWSTITEFAAKCVSPIVNMVLARVLTPEAFGIVATISVVVSFAEIFTDAGFQKYLVQHDFSSKEELNKHTNVAFWSNLILSMVLWGIITLFRNPLAKILGNPSLGMAISVAALAIPVVAFSSIQMARYKREFDFKTLFYVRIIGTITPLIVTVPLAILLRSYWALVIGTLVTNVVNAVVLTLCSNWKPRVYFSFATLKEMFSYSWWILLESLSVWLSSYIGTFIVGVFLSSYYVGLYQTSMATVNQFIGLITAATSAPLFVAMSRLKNDYKQLMETYNAYIHAICIVIIPLGAGMWLYRDLVTQILLGNQWLEAAAFIGLWGLTSVLVLAFGTYCNGLYNAVGKTYLSFATQIVHLVILIPALFWAASKGYQTLILTRCVVRLSIVVIQMITMRVFMKADLWKLIRGAVPPVLCTGIMTVVAVILMNISGSVIWGILSVCMCVVVYFLSFWIFFKKGLLRAMELFGIRKNKILLRGQD